MKPTPQTRSLCVNPTDVPAVTFDAGGVMHLELHGTSPEGIDTRFRIAMRAATDWPYIHAQVMEHWRTFSERMNTLAQVKAEQNLGHSADGLRVNGS